MKFDKSFFYKLYNKIEFKKENNSNYKKTKLKEIKLEQNKV